MLLVYNESYFQDHFHFKLGSCSWFCDYMTLFYELCIVRKSVTIGNRKTAFRIIAHQIIVSWTINPWTISPRKIAHQTIAPRIIVLPPQKKTVSWVITPQIISRWIIGAQTIALENNCLLINYYCQVL